MPHLASFSIPASASYWHSYCALSALDLCFWLFLRMLREAKDVNNRVKIRSRERSAMMLRRRMLLVIGLTLVALIVGLYGVCSSILLKDFARLERREAVRDVKRLQSTVADEVADLDADAAEWSEWDDTYQFMQDHNLDYIHSNLGETMLANMRLNFVVFLNREGQVVWSNGFDRHAQKAGAVPDSLLRLLKGTSPLLDHPNTESVHNGVLLLPEGAALVSSRPIITSQRTGPIRGTLILGRFL